MDLNGISDETKEALDLIRGYAELTGESFDDCLNEALINWLDVAAVNLESRLHKPRLQGRPRNKPHLVG